MTSRLEPGWIWAFLKNPEALVPGTTMPNPDLDAEAARAATAFLTTLE